MCGILGAVRLDGTALPASLRPQRMARALVHRGPDGKAFFESPRAVLGLLRLAIVAPTEPARVASLQGIHAVTNGEFYNHAALRRALPPELRPATRVDTALVPALFHAFGPEGMARVRGMFATALYDEKKHALHLWRDGCGKKPLFYAVADGTLLFASEAKALFASGLVAPRINLAAAARVLVRGFLDEDEPFAGDVRVLPPGGWLTAVEGRVQVSRPARVDQRLDDDGRITLDRLEDLLARAVERRAGPDVAAAVSLSSGVDSALVAHAARLPCFHVAMPQGEQPAAARMARRLKLPFSTVPLLPPSRATLRRVLWHLETPDVAGCWEMASGLLGLGQALQASGTRVLLTGEGADEIFHGYPWHRVEAALSGLWRLRPSDVTNLAMPHAMVRYSAIRRGGWGLRDARAMEVWRHAAAPQHTQAARECAPLLFPGVDVARVSRPGARAERFADAPHAARQRQLDALERDMHTLPVLHADRLLMASGVEARLPFLDVDLVAAALRVDEPRLADPTHEKPLVRALFERRVGMKAPQKRGYTGLGQPAPTEILSWTRALLRQGCAVVDGSALARLCRRASADDDSAVQVLWRAVVIEEMARVLESAEPPPL